MKKLGKAELKQVLNDVAGDSGRQYESNNSHDYSHLPPVVDDERDRWEAFSQGMLLEEERKNNKRTVNNPQDAKQGQLEDWVENHNFN